MDRLDAIFSPKSLAVVGASTTPGKVGHDIFVNILNDSFTGTLYPVNPKARSVACGTENGFSGRVENRFTPDHS
jgi:acyl-CoA synthetase (NDP forming)